MKFKTTAIAMAVAGIVAAPVAVQAGADEIYASARVGLWNVDEGGLSDLEIRSFASRFGAKGEKLAKLDNKCPKAKELEYGRQGLAHEQISSIKCSESDITVLCFWNT